VRTSSPAWSANTSATFRVSGRDRSGPGLDIVPLPSPILLQGKDVEGGVNRLVGMLSTGRIITTTGSQVQRQTLLGQRRGRGTLGMTNAAFFSRFSGMSDWPQPSPVVERRVDGRRGRRTAFAG
jgi:hypothetical protein